MGSQRNLVKPLNTSNSDICQIIEDKETDNFLDETYKKSVSNGIRKHNKEKKLQHKLSSQNITTDLSPDIETINNSIDSKLSLDKEIIIISDDQDLKLSLNTGN